MQGPVYRGKRQDSLLTKAAGRSMLCLSVKAFI